MPLRRRVLACDMRVVVVMPALVLAFSAAAAGASPGPPRDWQAHPAIVVVADGPQNETIYAVSDVHCAYARLAALLAEHKLIDALPKTPAAIHWSAGAATLVVVGDLIDKGPECIETVDAVIALQTSALAGGGLVIVTMGNHEAEFLADPTNKKAGKEHSFATALTAKGIDPQKTAHGDDERGRWLRGLPFAAAVGDWFFVHAGNTKRATLPGLAAALEHAVDSGGYGDPMITGPSSILESRGWDNSKTRDIASEDTFALGMLHIVVGHDPHGWGERGHIAHGGSVLFRIDCGMSPDVDDSKGFLLQVERGKGLSPDQADGLSKAGATRGFRAIGLGVGGDHDPLWPTPY